MTSRRSNWILLVLALLTISSSVCFANVIYVKWDSPNDGPGNNWVHAYHTVQAGLDAAAYKDEVWVAKGTYVERITLHCGVALYGGFVGTETSKNQRNWKANVTVLDGNNGGSGGSHVVSICSGDLNTCIDGFTIRNGSGGGIGCVNSSPAIRNNTITRQETSQAMAAEYTLAPLNRR